MILGLSIYNSFQFELSDSQKHQLIRNQYNLIQILQKEFSLQNPYVISGKSMENHRLMKQFFNNDQVVKLCSNIDDIFANKAVLKNDVINILYTKSSLEDLESLLKANSQISLFLILQDNQFDEILAKLNVEINQGVYFFKISTQEMYEAYMINNVHVKKQLGHINTKYTKFIWENNVNPNFIKRRSNFHGLTLKAMTEFLPGLVETDPTEIKNAPFHPNNETYSVSDYVSGKYIDILQILQERLNFSTQLYKRKDGGYGFIFPQSNGSFHGTGMVGDLFFKRADMIVTGLTMLYQRALYIDFLPPVGIDQVGQ